MSKEQPPVIFSSMESMEEANPLLKAEGVVVAEEPAAPARQWKAHFCNPFGDCGLHDWAHCCLVQWVPCVPFAVNMRRALNLNVFLQAALYLALFGGVARLSMGVVEHECPMWKVNPEYVKLHGEPQMPPPPVGATFRFGRAGEDGPHHHPHGPHHHHPGHEAGRHYDHEHHPEVPRAEEVAMERVRPAAEVRPAVAEFEMEVTVETKPGAVKPTPQMEKLRDAATASPIVAKLKDLSEKAKESHMQRMEMHRDEKEHRSAVAAFFAELTHAFAGPMRTAMAHAHAKHAERRGMKESEHGERRFGEAPEPEGPAPYVPNDKCMPYHVGAGAGCFVLSIIAAWYGAARRSQIREKFGIVGSHFNDFCAWLWCPFCALTQESRTLSHNNVENGEWPEPQAQYTVVPVVVMEQA